MPATDVAPADLLATIGTEATDRVGQRIGTVLDVYADQHSGDAEWVAITAPTGHPTFVPLAGARLVDHQPALGVDARDVASAPHFDATGRLSRQDEERLWAQYRLAPPAAVAGGIAAPTPNPRPTYASAAPRTAGAQSVAGEDGRKRRAPLASLPWAALALVALLGVLSYLVATNVTDENDRGGIDLADDEAPEGSDPAGAAGTTNTTLARGAAPVGTGATTGTAAAPAGAAATGRNNAGGTLAADGRPLLPLPAEGLGVFSGRPAQGRGAIVESVVSDEGSGSATGPATGSSST